MVNIIQILCYRQIVTLATNGLHNCYTLFFSTNALGHMLATDSTDRIITGQHCDCLNSFQVFLEKRKAEGSTTFCECFAVYLFMTYFCAKTFSICQLSDMCPPFYALPSHNLNQTWATLLSVQAQQLLVISFISLHVLIVQRCTVCGFKTCAVCPLCQF